MIEHNSIRYSHYDRKSLSTKLPKRNQPPQNQDKQGERKSSFQDVLDKEIGK